MPVVSGLFVITSSNWHGNSSSSSHSGNRPITPRGLQLLDQAFCSRDHILQYMWLSVSRSPCESRACESCRSRSVYRGGNRLRTAIRLGVRLKQPYRPTQPPNPRGTRNEYRPSAMMLCGSKSRMVHSTCGQDKRVGWPVKLVNTCYIGWFSGESDSLQGAIEMSCLLTCHSHSACKSVTSRERVGPTCATDRQSVRMYACICVSKP